MSSPIEPRIGQVFVPVSDIRRSAEWYCRILGLEGGIISHEDRIFDVPLKGDTKLCLDAHKHPTTVSVQPLCFFWTADMLATRQFLLANEVELDGDVSDAGSVRFLVFRDPDGNLLMVCEPNSEQGQDESTRRD